MKVPSAAKLPGIIWSRMAESCKQIPSHRTCHKCRAAI